MGQKNFWFRGEQKCVVKNAPVERLLAKPIAREQQPVPPEIPKRKGKHAVELVYHVIAIFRVEMRKDLGVRHCLKRTAALLELFTQLAIVINLSVQNDSDTLVFVERWLFARDQIDDREASHTERHALRNEQTL